MTLNSFIAQKRETELRNWFDKLPDYEAERCGDAYYEALNKLRQVRFNTKVAMCEECGEVFPRDDLTLLRKRGGKSHLVCTGCVGFGAFVRAMMGWAS